MDDHKNSCEMRKNQILCLLILLVHASIPNKISFSIHLFPRMNHYSFRSNLENGCFAYAAWYMSAVLRLLVLQTVLSLFPRQILRQAERVHMQNAQVLYHGFMQSGHAWRGQYFHSLNLASLNWPYNSSAIDYTPIIPIIVASFFQLKRKNSVKYWIYFSSLLWFFLPLSPKVTLLAKSVLQNYNQMRILQLEIKEEHPDQPLMNFCNVLCSSFEKCLSSNNPQLSCVRPPGCKCHETPMVITLILVFINRLHQYHHGIQVKLCYFTAD